MKTHELGLTGRGLMQSPEEWAVRTRVLAESLSQLVQEYLPVNPQYGLDVGCQSGELTDYLNAHTSLAWEGIDLALAGPERSANGALLYSGAADDIPYADCYFDCLLLANVFEHIPPERRRPSFLEMYRVLRPGSIVVGQLPNPYFPIEAHSRLPFMGWLPPSVQKKYWRLSPVPWNHDFFTVTVRHLGREAERAGFEVMRIRNYNYPPEAFPKAARWLAIVARRPMRRFPWAWQFVLKRQ